MRINSKSKFLDEQTVKSPSPKPGEIWEISRSIISPLEFSEREKTSLYSESARSFLAGNSPKRFVAIVKEAEPIAEIEPEWQIIYVMLLSVETNFISNVDLLVPPSISGLEQPVLAETWQVKPMLSCNLFRSVGQRLSRKIYDLLLQVGDYYYDLVAEYPSFSEIEALGLKAGKVTPQQSQEIKLFHQQEEAWSDVLQVPLAACNTYFKILNFTDELLKESFSLERDLSNNESPFLLETNELRVNLSQWLKNIFEPPTWQPPDLSLAVRGYHPSQEVRRVKKLGISPANLNLALECRLIPNSDRNIGILFRVYCQTKKACLPANLKLILLDQSGAILHQAIAERSDLYVQLSFNGEVGDRFSIKVAYQDIHVTEDFII